MRRGAGRERERERWTVSLRAFEGERTATDLPPGTRLHFVTGESESLAGRGVETVVRGVVRAGEALIVVIGERVAIRRPGQAEWAGA